MKDRKECKKGQLSSDKIGREELSETFSNWSLKMQSSHAESWGRVFWAKTRRWKKLCVLGKLKGLAWV